MRVLGCGQKPIGRLTESAFTLREDGLMVSALESTPRIIPNRQDFRVHTLVLVDLSGSITRNAGGVSAVRDAVVEFLNTISLAPTEFDHRVGVRAFDGRAETQEVSAFSSDLESVAADAAALKCGSNLCLDSSTNLNGAVVEALSLLEAQVADAQSSGVDFNESFLVIFTDGTDQAGRVAETTVLDAVEATGSRVLTIGLGSEIDESVLRAMGRDGFELAENLEQLAQSFGLIAQRVSDLAGSFYRVDYCSPKRAGEHSLEIEVAADGETGSVEGRFSADGFTFGCDLDDASCEAGFADCDAAVDGCETRIRNNDSHCGGCDLACRPGQRCEGETCV